MNELEIRTTSKRELTRLLRIKRQVEELGFNVPMLDKTIEDVTIEMLDEDIAVVEKKLGIRIS